MTFTADSTAPAGQTVALVGGPYYTTLSIPLTIDWGSDAGSGLNVVTQTVERRSATLSSGACGAYGSWAAVTLSAGADTTVANAKCYEYRVKVTDNVGNVSAYSATSADAYTDTSAPTATVALAESSPYTSIIEHDALLQRAELEQRHVHRHGHPDRRAVGHPEGDLPGRDGNDRRRRRGLDAVPDELRLDGIDRLLGRADHHHLQQRRPDGHEDLHDHKGHQQADRPDSDALGRPVLLDPLGAADDRERH